MYLLSQRRGGCTLVWMMVAPLQRARPSLQQSSFKSWTLKQLAGFCWPTNSRVIPDQAQEISLFSLFYFTMRMTRRGVRGDNSFSQCQPLVLFCRVWPASWPFYIEKKRRGWLSWLIGSSSFWTSQISSSPSLVIFLYFPFFFSLIFTTWRGETFVVVVRCQPLLRQFLSTFRQGLKKHTHRHKKNLKLKGNQRATVYYTVLDESVALFGSSLFPSCFLFLCEHIEDRPATGQAINGL